MEQNRKTIALPGDGGPCPICGEDMLAKEYESNSIFRKDPPEKVSGRYWHMKYEHHRWENYRNLGY